MGPFSYHIDDPDTLDDYDVQESPSVGTDTNTNPDRFVTPGTNKYQTIIPSGMVYKDQVFAVETTDDVIPPSAVEQYRSYLTTANKVRPPTNLSPTDFNINQQYVDEAKSKRDGALSAISGTPFTEEDLIVAAKKKPLSNELFARSQGTTAPTVVSQDFVPLSNVAGVYKYFAPALYDDRYDFETGKKIRVGLAGGIGGGKGEHTLKGNTTTTVEGSESTSNTSSVSPVVGDEKDPCD